MNCIFTKYQPIWKTETCIRVQTTERESQHTSKFYEQKKTLNAYSQIAIYK